MGWGDGRRGFCGGHFRGVPAGPLALHCFLHSGGPRWAGSALTSGRDPPTFPPLSRVEGDACRADFQAEERHWLWWVEAPHLARGKERRAGASSPLGLLRGLCSYRPQPLPAARPTRPGRGQEMCPGVRFVPQKSVRPVWRKAGNVKGSLERIQDDPLSPQQEGP